MCLRLRLLNKGDASPNVISLLILSTEIKTNPNYVAACFVQRDH